METEIDYYIISYRIQQCIQDNIRRGKNPDLNQVLLKNLDTAIIAPFYHLEEREVIEFNHDYSPPIPFIQKVNKPIYHLLIILETGLMGYIINIPNIELTFRDHDIQFATLSHPSKFNHLKDICHQKNNYVMNIYLMIDMLRDCPEQQFKYFTFFYKSYNKYSPNI